MTETTAHDADTCMGICCGTCARCGQQFDAADTRYDGYARHQLSDFCCGCVDRCHESEDADHRCVICTD
ncbi:hypothetical protein [Kitasatospora sp. NPDC090091]|uniref:hypothetical protein n=1 Tax=Kitasatospora sp. NPDC090091 TaxID=3364081 RepID=UPI0037FFB1D5